MPILIFSKYLGVKSFFALLSHFISNTISKSSWLYLQNIPILIISYPHCYHSYPSHLLLLPMLNCPLDAFPPLVLIYSFNIFPKQKSFSSANHHKKNFFYKQDRQSDILHTVLPYNSTSLIPSLLRVLNISFQNNLFP